MGRYDQAFSLFQRSQRVDPQDPAYNFFYGYYYLTRGDLEVAQKSFAAALLKKPDLMDALYFMGYISERFNNPEDAKRYYRKTVTSLDSDRGGYRKLAVARLAALR